MRPNHVILAYLLREARCCRFRPVGTDISWASNGPDPTGTVHRTLPATCTLRPRKHAHSPTHADVHRSVIGLPTRKHLHNMAALTSRRTCDDGISRQQLNDSGIDVVIIE